MRAWLGISIVFLISGYAGVSFAFPPHKFWHIPAAGDPMGGVAAGELLGRAGGGGIYYTGGTGDYGLKCSTCHINNNKQQGKIHATLTPSPAWASKAGGDAYVPGTTYTITVALTGEHLHNATMLDENGMNLTIEDAQGHVAGVFEANVGGKSDACMTANPLTVAATATQTTVIFGDCHGVLSIEHAPKTATVHAPRTSWNFKWTAPAAGAGDLTIFLGVVDGNEADVSSLDDDVVEVAIPLAEM